MQLDSDTFEHLQSEGLLTDSETLEMQTWFRASCRARVPLDLPDNLYTALRNALYLSTPLERMTRH